MGLCTLAQEGNRDRRNTRRQVLRLQTLIQLSKRRKQKLYVVYLDFENYFNSLPIEKTLTILAKFGIPAEEVEMLRRYFSDAGFTIRDQRGHVSARIPLRRGFRQGDPISPLLGSIIAECLSRLIDHQGLGFKGEDGAQHSHLFFVDDLTCASWGVEAMQRYLDVNCRVLRVVGHFGQP